MERLQSSSYRLQENGFARARPLIQNLNYFNVHLHDSGCMHACSTRIRLVVVCLFARVHAARAVLCAHAHDPMNGRIISLVIADLVCIRLAVIAGICQS